MLKLRQPEHVMLFAIGATMRVDVYILGRLAVAELLCMLALVVFWPSTKLAVRTRGAQTFLAFLGLWLFSIIASDIYNSTDINLFVRGAARPLIIGVMFIAFSILLRGEPKSSIFLLFGLAVSGIQNILLPTDFRAESLDDTSANAYFAFVYTPALLAISAFVAWLIYPKSNVGSAAFLALVGIASLENFSRTTSMALVMSSLLLLYGARMGLQLRHRAGRSSAIQLVGQAVIVGVIVYVALTLYIELALRGLMGERIMEKVSSQVKYPTSSQILNMFLTGRHYNISNYLMIKDNPLFGTGSWPLTGKYDYQAFKSVRAPVSADFMRELATTRGTGHSILFGGWANYGPLATIFWLYVLRKSAQLARELFTSDRRLFAAWIVFIIIFMFSLFFNNLNSLNRALAALIPAMAIIYTHRREIIWKRLQHSEAQRRSIPPGRRRAVGATAGQTGLSAGKQDEL